MPELSRRHILGGLSAAAIANLGSLRYAKAQEAEAETEEYRSFEDVMRQKWTWDSVAHSTHGTNCTGNCAFNVYVKNGIVWREEQQAQYGASDPDVPDYGPRGCQKGLRHAKYMYGPQRILYPMKRVGERGEGKWERITWEQATTEIADKFIDHAVETGVDSISCGLGTQMVVKRSGFASVARLGAITGIAMPESFAGVGDDPIGVQATFGVNVIGDSMAAVYKSRACLVWMVNPAVTRIPDAHFFWEARYNGTKVTAISPEFTPTAMHANRWLNPKPGTDAALAMSMVETILTDKSYDAEYVREQTDLPYLVRTDNQKFLRGSDMADGGGAEVPDNLFYVWDETSGAVVPAPATGTELVLFEAPGMPPPPEGALELGNLVPALEGTWTIETKDGPVEVTTVFEKLKVHCQEYTPEKTQAITGVAPENVRTVAREWAAAKPAMIFSGYSSCKWLHGDLFQRAALLMLGLTGNTGPKGGGFQITNLAKEDGIMAYAAAGVGPVLRVVSGAMWDYEHGKMKELNAEHFSQELADEIDGHYEESINNGWMPRHARVPWKMALFTGENAANWRASGKKWRAEAFDKIETIVSVATDMGITSHLSDYVLPVAHHYERQDIVLEPRTPYMQTLDAAVPPLGECIDDWTVWERVTKAISERATARNIEPIEDVFFGQTIPRDLKRAHELYTLDGTLKTTKDMLQFIIDNSVGLPKIPFDELAEKGMVRLDDSDGVIYGEKSCYNSELWSHYNKKTPYKTLTRRQQYYIDHDWFLKFGEDLPGHRDPLELEGYPLRMIMGHARHGIHSMWRDDPLMLSLQRGEPDVYVSPVDAGERGVADGDLIKVFNSLGDFIAQAHVSSGMQPGMIFMYHGWDPMMFRGKKNFNQVTATAGLIKPTHMVGNYGHLSFNPIAWVPNETQKDFTCNFEKYEDMELDEAI